MPFQQDNPQVSDNVVVQSNANSSCGRLLWHGSQCGRLTAECHRQHYEGDSRARRKKRFLVISSYMVTRIQPHRMRFQVQFQNLFRENEPRKSILKRETHSFDEYRRGLQRCNDGNHSDYLDCGPMARKAKSFEERDEDYDHVTLHSFKKRGGQQNARDGHHEPTAGGGRSNGGSGAGDACWPIWGISEGSVHEQPLRRSALNLKSSRLLKMQSLVSCMMVERWRAGRVWILKVLFYVAWHIVCRNEIGRASSNLQVVQFWRLWSSFGCAQGPRAAWILANIQQT